MTYGEFAWEDAMRSPAERHRWHDRSDRLRVFVPGEPVRFMDAGEGAWSRRVARAVRSSPLRPHLEFVLTGTRPPCGLDELCKPVLDVIAGHGARSVWAGYRSGAESGLWVGDVGPGLPPRIDRAFEVESPVGYRREWLLDRSVIGPPLRGQEAIGAHVTLARGANLVDFGFDGVIRPLLHALAVAVGGGSQRRSYLRIRELRLVTESARASGAEVRLWRLGR